jgi:DNA-binding response OmpR family regulator
MPHPAGSERPPGLRVVVTDDNPALLALLIATLRSAGHCVFAAYDGLAACELATQLPNIQLLITNTRLAGVNAPELIRRVREEKPWLAILHVGDPLPEAGGFFGDVPTLREPFAPDQLLAAVRALMEKPRA